jgi:O-antigen/teichoic acid export membrane protein
MTEKIANIAKNTSYFTIALILQKVISFSYFTIIARALGPEDLGKYYFAISFTAIFAIFIDLGLSNVLTREVARFREDPDRLLGVILGIKIPLAIFTWLAVIAASFLLGYSDIVRYLIYLSTICMVLDSFTASFFAVSRGFHNLVYESIASILFQLVVLSTGILILKLDLGLVALMAALSAASIFNFLYSSFLVWRKFNLKIKPVYDRALFKIIIGITAPFAIYGILQRLYTYLDSVLLSHFAGDHYVGIYQVAFKIIFALQFLPLAFTASLYPAMSTYWTNNKKQLGVTFERAMNYLIIIALPIAVGIAAIADKVVLIFSSEYSDAVLPLQINMAALVFIFIGYPIGSLLNACDRQKTNTMNMAITTGASIILNIILIPKFQAVGASITVAVTNLLMFSLGWLRVPKVIEFRSWAILSVLIKSVLAAGLMAFTTIYLKNYLPLFATVFISGSLYFLILYFTKTFRRQDILSVYQSFRKKNKAAE